MRWQVIVLASLLVGATLRAEQWTESFETGVGRLDQTTGNGDTVFVYDPSTQSIDATFVRPIHGTPTIDHRFAILEDGPLDAGTGVTRFSLVMTPLSATDGSNLSAKIGLLDVFGVGVGHATVDFARNSQVIGPQFSGSSFDPVAGIPFSYGETYYIEATLDGPGHRFIIDVYRGMDASIYLGHIDRGLVPDAPLIFDSFGLAGTGTGSEPSQFRATIHEVSLFEIAQPLEWRAAEGGNGHYYEFVEAPLITWADARIAAASRTYLGNPGHLFTSTSIAENDFVRDFSENGTGTFGWIGASDSIVEGEWRWVEGPELGIQFWQGNVNGVVTPPFDFANWAGRDPTGSGENFAVFGLGPWDVVRAGEWGDANNNGDGAPIVGYFVEYSGPDCDGDGIPNDRLPDCNANGVPDECDLTNDTSADFNANSIPDECEPDCQANGIPDFIEVALGTSDDCNQNDVPDECDMERPPLLVAAVLPSGPSHSPKEWGPVLVVDIDGPTTFELGTTIPKEQVSDPAGAAFDARGELFIGNRHGGSGGSISRFLWSPESGFAPNGTITGNGLDRVHDVVVSTDGELFAANIGGGVSRFVFDAAGNAIANGMISTSFVPDSVAFAPWGELFVSRISGADVHRFVIDPDNGEATSNGSFNAPDAGFVAFMRFDVYGDLFLTAFDTNRILRCIFDEAKQPTCTTVTFVENPVDVDFGPRGEMFVASHAIGGISRFLLSDEGEYVLDGFIPTPSLGGLAVLPASLDCNLNQAPDECESNGDDDFIIDDCDNCFEVANRDQVDFDDDGIGDACDPDIDNDGVENEFDVCDFTALGAAVDEEGRSLGDIDQDCDTDLDDFGLFQRGFAGATNSSP